MTRRTPSANVQTGHFLFPAQTRRSVFMPATDVRYKPSKIEG